MSTIAENAGPVTSHGQIPTAVLADDGLSPTLLQRALLDFPATA